MQKYKKVIACFAGVAVVFIWSGWITLSRYGMKTPLTPSDLTMLRYATDQRPYILWYYDAISVKIIFL